MILKVIISAVLGGISGYALYYFIGCRTGTCPITANPWYSTIWGILLGITISWK